MLQQTYRKIFLIASCFLTNYAMAQTVYQAINPDGKVVYTDNINTAYQHGQSNNNIKVLDNLDRQTPSFPSSAVIPPNFSNHNDNITTIPTQANHLTHRDFPNFNISSTKASKIGDYQIKILSPKTDDVFRRPTAENIQIQLDIQPKLSGADHLQFWLNGQKIHPNDGLQLNILDLNPNSYQLQVKIVNGLNETIAEDNIRFYVLQTNTLIQQKKRQLAEKQAYDALPWYKKWSIHIRQPK